MTAFWHRRTGCLGVRRDAVLLLGLFVGVMGCQGGGHDGGGGTPGPPSLVGLFTPERSMPDENTLSLKSVTSGADLDLTVQTHTVGTMLSGAAFDLAFDPEIVTYVGYTAGDFFERAGATTYGVAARDGRLIVGVTGGRVGQGPSGSGSLITLHFRAKATGSSTIAFKHQALCSIASAVGCDRQPLLVWHGGTYAVS